MPKAADRLKALQQRSAAYVTPSSSDNTGTPGSDDLADTQAYFGAAPLQRLTQGRVVERLPVGAIAPDMRPDHRQPRLLPLPDTLRGAQGQDEVDAALVAELHELGQSLRERQLQPIVVYPGRSDLYPAARYLILVGHRRWTAAVLVELETIDTIVVEPPAPAERVIAQYVENESRAEFSDMERAWALVQLKEALGDPPWEVVEERVHLSRSRRQDLLRLLAFTTDQQTQIARLRLSETQVRPLHTAVRNAELAPAHVDTVLAKLPLPVRRAATDEQAAVQASPITGPAIARLVTQTQRAASGNTQVRKVQWVGTLTDQLARTEQALLRARRRLGELSQDDATILHERLTALTAQMAALVVELQTTAADAAQLEEVR